jgi:ribose transport system permease protein
MLKLKKMLLAAGTGGETVVGGEGRIDFLALAKNLLLRYAMVWILIILVILANSAYDGFLEWGNIRNLLSQNAPIGLVAIGMTFVIIAGGFDLSVSGIFALAAVLWAGLSNDIALVPACALAIAAGVVCGVANGLIVTKLKVNPFVATLGSASIFSGLAYLYAPNPIVAENPGFSFIGTESWLGLPISVWILGVAFVIGGFLLSRTVYGRSIYSIGGNDEAARLCGMRVDTIRASTYAITGLCAALAGALLASKTSVGQADMGATLTLDAIAIVIIGGTSLMGGEGAMWRTLVGLLILATINNLFESLAFDVALQSVVKGSIIIVAVALDAFSRSRR